MSMKCQRLSGLATCALVVGSLSCHMASANEDSIEVNRPFFSFEATQQELQSASNSLYSGIIAKESPYKTLNGKIMSATNFVVDYPAEGVTLGQGWELGRSVKSFSTCIDFEEQSVGGQMATVKASKVFSSEELKREVETSISASAKASYGGFGASAKYKSNMVKKSKVESSFDTRLVKAEVVDGVEFVAPLAVPESGTHAVVLSSYALALLDLDEKGNTTEESLNAFWRHCGDAYVSAIERGAEMYIVSNNFNHSGFEEAQSSKTIGGSVSYLGNGVKAESMSSSLESALNTTKSSKFEYYHSAHRGLFIPSRIDDVARAIQLLGDSSEQNKSFPFRVQLTSYSDLPNFPTTVKLTTPTGERLYVYRDRLESITAMLEHMLDYTLVDESDETKTCKPASVSTCVRKPNLATYYHSEDNAERRNRYEALLKAVNRDVLIVSQEIEQCEKAPSTCVAEFDGKYSDYFYRALLPLPRVAQLYVDDEANALLEKKKNDLETLENSFDGKTSRTFRVEKSCWHRRLWKCDHKTVVQTCKEFREGEPCIKHKRQEEALKISIAALEHESVEKYKPLARFEYYIEDTLERRKENGALEVELSEREIQYLVANVNCEILKWKHKECNNIDSIYDRIVHDGERLRFVYVFNPEAQHRRLRGYAESAAAEIQKNNGAMKDIIIKLLDANPDNPLLQTQNKDLISLDDFKELLPDIKIPEGIENEYQWHLASNKELGTLSKFLLDHSSIKNFTLLSDDQETDKSSIITPYSLYKVIDLNEKNRFKTMSDSKKLSGESEHYKVEPLYPIISFEADFELYVQGY
ncbi:TPA: ATPase [Vibrio parahaemolyticus]